jgi:cytoskeletal protein RodZ
MTTLGELLRERRLEHQWTLEDVAQRTRVRQKWLAALEEGDFGQLPADVHARGFLRAYAELLGLDAEEVFALYEQERGRPDLVSIAPLSRPPRRRSCILPGLGAIVLTFLIIAAVAVVLDRGWLNPATIPPTETPPIPTPTNILPTATPTVRLLLETPTPTAGPTEVRTYDGLEAVLELTADCWVRVTADGIQIFQGTLRAGTTHTYTAQEELSIRFGNAGGVRVVLNGEDLGIQGAAGQVVTKTWSKEE